MRDNPDAMLSRPSESETVPTLRDAMRQLAGGVSLVTAGDGPERVGFTASSVSSLTLEPPCILVCVNRTVSAWSTIERIRRFCVNVLADRHESLAVRFSGATGVHGAARFEQGAWSVGPEGTPVLADALAAVECELDDVVERHSHLIVIGAVRSIRTEHNSVPLLYAQGGYGRFEPR